MRIVNLNDFREEEDQYLLIPESKLEKFLLWVLSHSKMVEGRWVTNLAKPLYCSLIVVCKSKSKNVI